MSGFARHRDHYAGALVALLGAGAIQQGAQYGIGGLSSMGSGFFPVALGAALVVSGCLMALFATPAAGEAARPDWRGAAAIAGAVALFMALANTAGLAPAIFACVFTGAMGTRATPAKEALALAAGVTAFGVLLFSFVLKVQFPVVRGLMP